MTYFFKILFLLPLLVFTACSSKNELKINEQMNSFSLYKNVVILSTPQTVPSPFSIGLGVGSSISRHVGVSMGTTIRPEISNDEALDLERSIALHKISLSNIIKNEFSQQMKNDEYYQNKFVPFGANYTVHLFIPKFLIDKSIFSSNANLKVYIDLEILNKNSDVIYSDSVVNESFSYKENSLLNNKMVLEKALIDSIEKSIKELISNMKKS